MHPEIVAEAREWLRTPFVWQASLKGVGCDCKGLVVGVARELGRPEAQSLHAQMASYSLNVPEHELRAGLAANLTKVAEPEPGDVLLLRLAGKAQHLGIYTGEGVIHTYGRGPKQVIETSAPVCLRAWPLDSAWRFSLREGG